jgi:predicted nucleotidyltransferase
MGKSDCKMRFREGDFLETKAGLVFDVKGLVHPPGRVVAFIRYFPDGKGVRKRGTTAYGKVYSLSERYALLRRRFPRYVMYDPVFDETLCEVPVGEVKKHHRPAERLRQLRRSGGLDALEMNALGFAEFLKGEAKVPWSSIGISGSLLAGLQSTSSDIDLLVYGSSNCRRVFFALKDALKTNHSPVWPYTVEDLKVLFDFRSKDTSVGFDDFVRTESTKALQGKFMGTDYFVRCVKDWGEVDEEYGDVQYKSLGYETIEATVTDDSEAIFTPCVYKVTDVKNVTRQTSDSIEEIASFRGRFCEQARTGDVVVAQGKVERVLDRRNNRECLRLLVGNGPSDYMAIRA